MRGFGVVLYSSCSLHEMDGIQKFEADNDPAESIELKASAASMHCQQDVHANGADDYCLLLMLQHPTAR